MTNLKPKQKGNLTELQSIAAFYELGYQVSIPYGEDSRYDFIADVNGNLLKIQCKTSHEVENGVISFSCRRCYSDTKRTHEKNYTKEDIDYFCTFWNGKCYLIPVNECSKGKYLRFIPTKNGQKEGIVFAKDYEIQTILMKFN